MSTELLAPVLKPSQASPTSASGTRSPASPQAPEYGLRSLQRSVGNQAVQRLLQANLLQAKLTVSQPGDIYEREADQVAETVMRTPQAAVDTPSSPPPNLLRAADAPGAAPEVTGDVESAVLAQTTAGQPLPPSARAFFEPRLNADLANVRVHTDAHAADSAQSVGARAFTLGNHIVFNKAEYAPESDAGRKLLAHELVHVIQQGGSPQAVQRQTLVDEAPATQTAPTRTPTTETPATSGSVSSALATGGATVHTDWFVDFSGVANNGRKKGRGDRDPGDVLILEDFTVGPRDDARSFPKAGDAQKSGYSRLGSYEHPRGPGSAFGTVSYATRRELDVKLTWDGQKKRETNPAALAAARATVEKLILHQSEVSGDWNEVESRAAAAAAERLPEGSNPKVEIQWRGNHQEYSLKTVDYAIRTPSLCTAEISVPTTSSAVDWSASDTKQHDSSTQTHAADQTHVDTDVETAHAHATGQSNSSLNVAKEHEKDAFDAHHVRQTRTYTDYELTWEEIEQSSKHVYIGMSESLRRAWLAIIHKLEGEPGAKTIPHEEEKELGWGDKVKKWFKDRGKDVVDIVKNKLYGKVKRFFSGKIMGFLKKLLVVGEEVEAWWLPIVAWGVDWTVGKLGDKIKSWLWSEKGKDERDTPSANSKYPSSSLTTRQLYDQVRNVWLSSEEQTDIEKDTRLHFRSIYDDYEMSSSNLSHEHAKDTLDAKAHADSTSEADANHTRVRTAVDHQGSTDTSVGDVTTTSRSYHGTTIHVTAGQPILTIKIQEKP